MSAVYEPSFALEAMRNLAREKEVEEHKEAQANELRFRAAIEGIFAGSAKREGDAPS
jgi:hypothetical protein